MEGVSAKRGRAKRGSARRGSAKRQVCGRWDAALWTQIGLGTGGVGDVNEVILLCRRPVHRGIPLAVSQGL